MRYYYSQTLHYGIEKLDTSENRNVTHWDLFKQGWPELLVGISIIGECHKQPVITYATSRAGSQPEVMRSHDHANGSRY